MQAGRSAGESVGVIAVKLRFLSSGMTDVRVNAHGIAIGTIILGEETRAQARKQECDGEERRAE
jgi:hypothetical protein